MFGLARTAQLAGWSGPVVDPRARRTGTAATLSTVSFTGINGGNYSTSKAQFGAGALDVSASNSLIYSGAYSGPWPSGTGDFCIEGWTWIPSARSSTLTGDPLALDVSSSGGAIGLRFGSAYTSGNFNYIQLFARGNADLDRAPITWPRDQWVHWAVQRKSAVISLWANGNKLTRENGPSGTAATRSFAGPNGSGTVTIGSYAPGGTEEELQAWLDEVCVSNSWRYDDSYSTYTVPTAAFTVDEYTDLLIHFDSNLTSASS